MSNRYEELYRLPAHLYVPGSPIMIVAGALLKDNQTGKVLAQLKIKNINPKKIKAVKVNITFFDTAKRELNTKVEYQYLDLNAIRDAYFGEQVPITISDASARSYEIAITEVIFEDNTIWTSSDSSWKNSLSPIPLAERIPQPELRNQYRLATDLQNANYCPTVEDDLWICACGGINHDYETRCHSCYHTLSDLQKHLNIAKLQTDCDVRLKEEAEKAKKEKQEQERIKAEKEEQKKKAFKRALPIAVSAVIVLIIAVVAFNAMAKHNAYEKAIALMDAEYYYEAIDAFEELDGYKESDKYIVESRFRLEIEDEDRFDILEWFCELSNYEYTAERMAQMQLNAADAIVKDVSGAGFDGQERFITHASESITDSNYLTYLTARITALRSINDAYSLYQELPKDYLDVSKHIADIEKYLPYTGTYVNEDDKCNVFIAFSYENLPYASPYENSYKNYKYKQLQISSNEEYDYFWKYNDYVCIYLSKGNLLMQVQDQETGRSTVFTKETVL